MNKEQEQLQVIAEQLTEIAKELKVQNQLLKDITLYYPEGEGRRVKARLIAGIADAVEVI